MSSIINKTVKCRKCKSYFYTYDGIDVCEGCYTDFEYDEQEVIENIKNEHSDELNEQSQ